MDLGANRSRPGSQKLDFIRRKSFPNVQGDNMPQTLVNIAFNVAAFVAFIFLGVDGLRWVQTYRPFGHR